MQCDGAEFLMDAPMARCGQRMMQALASVVPGAAVTDRYEGRHRLLVLYGPGSALRMHALRCHVAAGGRVAAWDLGYWDRDEALRLSVDDLHPTAEQIAMAPADVQRTAHVLREDADPDGPVLLIGIGDKSCAAYRLQPGAWERDALAKIKRCYSGRTVLWRPKGRRGVPLPGTTLRVGGTIEDAMRGCSLVWCRHSNVAVDACIAGVPVRCAGGAASALYFATQTPTREQRAEFLRRLGWWQWRPAEAAEAWAWIKRATA